MPNENELSEREREILRLVATGASNKEIAQKLVISTNTVKVHLRNIFSKLEVTSRTEATLFAIRIGLVSSPSDPASQGDSAVQTNDTTGEAKISDIRQTIYQVLTGLFPASPLLRNLTLGVGSLLIVFLTFFAARGIGNLFPAQAITPPFSTLAASSQSRWTSLGTLPQAVSNLAAAVYDGQIFTIGGETSLGVTGAVASYDISTQTWSNLASKPTPVADASAVVLGGLIYVPGGRLESGAETDVLEVFDPEGNTWVSKAPLPVAVSGYALAVFEGKLYLFGGWDGKEALAEVYVYSPETDLWEARTPMPGPKAYAGAAVAGGKIYVIGGYDGTKALDANQAYLPERDKPGEIPWVAEARLPKGRYRMGITSLADTIYIIGGMGDAMPIEYVTQADEWRELEASPAKVDSDLTLVWSDTYIFSLGGVQAGIKVDELQSYKALYTIAMPIVR